MKIYIIGFGIIGSLLTAKLALKYPENEIIVFEKEKEDEINQLKFWGGHFYKDAIELLKNLNIYNNFKDNLKNTFSINYNINKFKLSIKNKDNYLIPQILIERELRNYCKNLKQVSINFCTEIVEITEKNNYYKMKVKKKENITSIINTQKSLIFACDGPNSFIRKKLNIRFIGKSYNEWIVVDYHNEKIDFNANFEWNITNKPFMYVSLLKNHFRIEFHSSYLKNNFQELDNDYYKLLRKFLPENIYNIIKSLKPDRFSKYIMHNRFAETFQKKNLYLVGDSAHVIIPFLGKGITEGFNDVKYIENNLFNLEKYTKIRKNSLKMLFYKSLILNNIIHMCHNKNKFFIKTYEFILYLLPKFIIDKFLKFIQS